MIRGKINVSKIDKDKLYKGEKGVYLDVVLIPTPNSQFGDFMICQEISQEERLAGNKGAILGNAKNIVPRTKRPTGVAASAPPEPKQGEDDVPF